MSTLDTGSVVGSARSSAEAGVLSRRRALFIVGLAAAVSALVHLLAALGLSAPWVMPDELIYSELAKSIGDGSFPGVRGETTPGTAFCTRW